MKRLGKGAKDEERRTKEEVNICEYGLTCGLGFAPSNRKHIVRIWIFST